MHDETMRAASAVDLFGLAMSQTSVGMFLADPSGRFLDVNEAAARMLGRTVEELRSLSAADLRSPDDSAPALEQLAEVSRESGTRSPTAGAGCGRTAA